MTKKNEVNYKIFSNKLLDWYDVNKRDLPWRVKANQNINPYHILISEFMLQQTLVVTVIPYFLRFINKWKTIDDLAKANFEEVAISWSGLGYYRRAKNLHETAKIISRDYCGDIPRKKEILLSFPGIGDYTASAIMAIAFNIQSNVVDGNIERIFSRLYKIEKPLEKSKKFIKMVSEKHLPGSRHGDYAQALMDLGSLICVPNKPKCGICPMLFYCKVGNKKIASLYPKRLPKKIKDQRYGIFFILINQNKEILFYTNKKDGLFVNMDLLPSLGWYQSKFFLDHNPDMITEEIALFNFKWKIFQKKLFHVFSHFKLSCTIAYYQLDNNSCKNFLLDEKTFRFVNKNDFNKLALPTLMKKIIKIIEDENLINY